MTLPQENGEVPKYEVKKLGATELRRHGGGRQSRNDACGVNLYSREDDASLMCRASESRIGTGTAAIIEKFLGGTGEMPLYSPHTH